MPHVRRAAYVIFTLEDGRTLDWDALFRGTARTLSTVKIRALSIATRSKSTLTRRDLDLLLRVPESEWIDEAEFMDAGEGVAERIEVLTRAGLLLSDRHGSPFRGIRESHERLAAAQWNLYAAVFHFLTLRSDFEPDPPKPRDLHALARANALDEEAVTRMVEQLGPPPRAFHSAGSQSAAIDLPVDEWDGALMSVLQKRRTTRGFDRERALPLAKLATILRAVFGCHGTHTLYGRLEVLRKTSPSGGSLHPVEAYPLALNVEGLAPGLYHYNVERHALAPLEILNRAEAEDLADRLTAGQSFPCSSHALVILTARWFRCSWKYRYNPRAYGVVLMDAGHLSQAFYLVCAELGFGAFVTAAINESDADKHLGIDGIEEGSIAILGCGIPLRQPIGLEPQFEPYAPARP